MAKDDKIMEGAEPISLKGSKTGVLVSHGFTGTTQSMRYLAEGLHEASGYTVVAPRLAGHGISPDAMARTGMIDWIGSVEEALAELQKSCDRIFMTGLSMGGTLTLNIAARYPDVILGAIPINAAAGRLNGDMAAAISDKNVPQRIPGVGSDIKDPEMTELAYQEIPLSCCKEAYALFGATHDLLPRIACPILIIQSREDHVVPFENAKVIADSVASKRIEMIELKNSYHVATIDNDKDLIVEKTDEFIRSVA